MGLSLACPDCAFSITTLALWSTSTRAAYWCEPCSASKTFATSTPVEHHPRKQSSGLGWDDPEAVDDPAETLLDPSPVVRGESLDFGHDHPARRELSRLLVQERLARSVLRIETPVPVRMLAQEFQEAQETLADIQPKIRAARETVRALPSQPWHGVGRLTPFQRECASVMQDGYENHGRRRKVFSTPSGQNDSDGWGTMADKDLDAQGAIHRDHLAKGGWQFEFGYVQTGRPNGRPPRQAPSTESLAAIVARLELETGLTIATMRRAIGQGKRSSERTSTEDAVRRLRIDATDVAGALECARRTITRWRKKCPANPLRGEAELAAEVPIEWTEAA